MQTQRKYSDYRLSMVTLLLLFLLPVSTFAAVSLTSRVDRNRITVYDRITYVLTLETDSRNAPDPLAPDFNGFKVLGPPRTSTQFSWVNGQTTNTRSYSYSLQAKAEGEYVIGPAKVTIRGQVYQSTPQKIFVSKPGKASSNSTGADNLTFGNKNPGNLFIRAVVDKDVLYVGEPLTVSYFLYTRVQIRDYGFSEQPDYKGFWVEQVELPDQPSLNQRMINGVQYGEAKIHEVVLYPTVTGDLTIPPVTMILKVQSRDRDPFGGFPSSFRSGFFGTRRETRSSQAIEINVKPLPQQTKPDDFSGSVGNFRIEAEINNTEVKTGEAIIVRVTLKGKHGLQTVSPPLAPELDQFKLFEPKSEEIIPDTANPGWMKKTWEYIMVPHQPGTYTIPSFTFSYFNPAKADYEQLKTRSFPIKVDVAPGSGMIIQTGSGKKEIQLLNLDIRYIKTGGKLNVWTAPYKRSWFLAVMILPFIVVPVIFVINRRLQRLEEDTGFARTVRARSVSGKRFAVAQKHLGEDNLGEALDDAAAAFARYLSDRLGMPAGGITLNDVFDELNSRVVDDSLKENIRLSWEKLETARYAPVNNSRENVTELIQDVQKLVDCIEKEKLKKQRGKKQKRGRL